MVKSTSAPAIHSITTKAVDTKKRDYYDKIIKEEKLEIKDSPEEIEEGEECFVGETDSKGNTVQHNSHVPF